MSTNSNTSWHRAKKTKVLLRVGHLYVLTYKPTGSRILCRLIKTSPKGYNFLFEKKHACLLRSSIIPYKIHDDSLEFIFAEIVFSISTFNLNDSTDMKLCSSMNYDYLITHHSTKPIVAELDSTETEETFRIMQEHCFVGEEYQPIIKKK